MDTLFENNLNNQSLFAQSDNAIQLCLVAFHRLRYAIQRMLRNLESTLRATLEESNCFMISWRAPNDHRQPHVNRLEKEAKTDFIESYGNTNSEKLSQITMRSIAEQ